MSSTTSLRFGSSSLISMPHWPRCSNLNGEPKHFADACARLSYLISPGNFWPSYFVSIGLGSKRSTCDGPPIMKSEIIALAFGSKCGGFGVRSKRTPMSVMGFTGAASRPSCFSSEASAREPRPKPLA